MLNVVLYDNYSITKLLAEYMHRKKRDGMLINFQKTLRVCTSSNNTESFVQKKLL